MHMEKLWKVSATTGLLAFLYITNAAAVGCAPNSANRPVCPAGAVAEDATFIDPTATILNAGNVALAKHIYIAPFVEINPGIGMMGTAAGVTIGEKSDLQDNVVLNGSGIALGDEVILAHGARVNGPAIIGREAVVGARNAAFVGFNSLVDRGNIEPDAMVLHLARVAPGITIRTGRVVLSGKNVTTQSQADDPALGKVIPITDGLRIFMDGVLHVNETFAREYTNLYYNNPDNVKGINYDPSDGGALPSFNPTRDLPTLAGVDTRDPNYRNRIIGDVVMSNSKNSLSDTYLVGSRISLRADEGEPFHVGKIERMNDRTTFHALEHTGIQLHDDITYGMRSIVHGGASAATANNPHSETTVGDYSKIGNYAVVFRSTLGRKVQIGCGSLVDGATLADNTVIPARTIVINAGHTNPQRYPVEWNPGC